MKENKFVPFPLIEEDKIAMIKIEEVIVAGTEYFIIPKNTGISAMPATAICVSFNKQYGFLQLFHSLRKFHTHIAISFISTVYGKT